MCLSPNKLPNPWFCPFPLGHKLRFDFEKRFPLWFLHDTTSAYMIIPCGRCSECLQFKQMEYIQRTYELSKFCHVLYGTLTYADWAIPTLDVNGFKIKFAFKDDFQNFIKRLRKYKVIPQFRYLAVSEFGSQSNKHKYKTGYHYRPHFHFLFFIPKDNSDKFGLKGFEYAQKVLSFIPSKIGWCRNISDNFNPLYVPNSRFIRYQNSYTYDCQYVQDIKRVSFYVTKYILKYSEYVNRLQSALRLNTSEEEYYKIWSIVRPKLFTSNGLGYIEYKNSGFPLTELDEKIYLDLSDMIKHSLANSKQPMFYFEHTSMPMCKYFVDKILDIDSRILFHNINYEAGPFQDECIDIENIIDFQDNLKKDIDKSNKFINLQSHLDKDYG